MAGENKRNVGVEKGPSKFLEEALDEEVDVCEEERPESPHCFLKPLGSYNQ